VEVASREASVRDGQPYLHELVTVVAAPGVALSESDGQLTGAGATGVYLADRRVLSRLVVGVDVQQLAPVGGQSTGTATARFVGVARHLGDPGPDRRSSSSGTGRSPHAGCARRSGWSPAPGSR
jgi:hypothetical protein